MSAGPWSGWPACPCGCGVEGLKLQLHHDRHVVGCGCASCRGRRSRRKGKAAERRRHLRLGGVGATPADDLAHVYQLAVTTEDKAGAQIPASFRSFVASEWYRHAIAQARKKLPLGSPVLPAVYLETTRSRWWLVVEGSDARADMGR